MHTKYDDSHYYDEYEVPQRNFLLQNTNPNLIFCKKEKATKKQFHYVRLLNKFVLKYERIIAIGFSV